MTAPNLALANTTLSRTVAVAEQRYTAGNPISASLAEKSRSVMPGGNTRTTVHFDPFPITIAHAKESWLHDVDGHRYADFVNEYSAGVYGHNHPVIRAAILEALELGVNLGAPTVFEEQLASHLVQRFPSINLVRFCNSGTEANLLALGLARAVTGRQKILVFSGGYHGSLFYFYHGSSPINAITDVVEARYNDWTDARQKLEQYADQLAAVIIEPMQGASGCIPAEKDFLAELRNQCSSRGIILIFDEVMTSRLSIGGLQKLLEITPDLTTLGKYIGGGVTLAAFGGRAVIMQRFDPRSATAIPHGGTFNNNILAMIAGVRAFEKVLLPRNLEAMNELGSELRARINEFASAKNLPFQMTGVGSLIGIHWHSGKITRTEDLETDPAKMEVAQQLTRLLHFDFLAAGHYIARRGYMALSLCTTANQVDKLAKAFEEYLTVHRSFISQLT
jgi:glutamate-1-semialdehyde 2,1-aminomutase